MGANQQVLSIDNSNIFGSESNNILTVVVIAAIMISLTYCIMRVLLNPQQIICYQSEKQDEYTKAR